ncbi:expressed unknown protein [Seminavis robusta]|uniref:Uncharacterized protein n=1 Tax=Seminavis robusta TaxID=568900 RepID=A0A9N8HML6_9STRA|nr:expressed unknown protein [Seminavis robusta]|eukprot:Sro1010_g230930.1 n/a (199) ;mRNA; r:32635-33231
MDNPNLPIIVGAAVVVVLALLGFVLMSKKKKEKSDPYRFGGKKDVKNVKVKAKIVWLEASDGQFDTTFDYQARKEIKNSKLRFHFQTIVDAWAKHRCGGIIITNSKNGREKQVIKFKDAQKVNRSPYLAIDFVAFTSDQRRVLLFLEGLKYEEIKCEEEIFELGKANILACSEGGRKTCQKSNLAFRETFIAPTQKKD